MGATTEDTQREITRLRADATAALEELQRRVRGGVQAVASGEARAAGQRARERLVERAAETPGLAGLAATTVVAAAGYGFYRLVGRWRARRTPRGRLERRVREVGDQVKGRIEDSRQQVERARRRGLLLKVGGEADGGVRVTDAGGAPPAREKGSRSDVLKKLLWAGLLAIFMAGSGVLARRLAGDVWRATVREEPPTQRG